MTRTSLHSTEKTSITPSIQAELTSHEAAETNTTQRKRSASTTNAATSSEMDQSDTFTDRASSQTPTERLPTPDRRKQRRILTSAATSTDATPNQPDQQRKTSQERPRPLLPIWVPAPITGSSSPDAASPSLSTIRSTDERATETEHHREQDVQSYQPAITRPPTMAPLGDPLRLGKY
jgi:hypothetical protein